MRKTATLLIALFLTTTNINAQWPWDIWVEQLDIQNWTSLERIFFLDENYGWTIGSAGPYFFTTNGGENWYLDPNWWPDHHWGNDIVFLNPDTGFIAGGGGKIHKTIDGGQTWTHIQTPATVPVLRLFFVDANNGWATITYPANVLRTVDGSENWELQSIGLTNYGNIEGLFFINNQIGYSIGSDYIGNQYSNIIWKTENNGISWDLVYSAVLENWYRDLFFTNASLGWIVGQKNGQNTSFILQTQNGATTWLEQTIQGNPKPEIIHCVYFINETTGWLGAGTTVGGAIYFTSNGGQNWNLQQEFVDPIYDIHMLNKDTGWAVGGSYVYYTDGVTGVFNTKARDDVFKIIPNPTNGVFRLEAISKSALNNCHLHITNIMGNTVYQLLNTSFEELSNKSIHLSQQPAGIYFIAIQYEINNQIKIINQKIIKL